MNASLGAGARALKTEWEAFLKLNKVTGLSMPLTNRWQLKGLAAKKLFYWSSRFSSYSSATAFARATAAMEVATVKGVPIYVNFNVSRSPRSLLSFTCMYVLGQYMCAQEAVPAAAPHSPRANWPPTELCWAWVRAWASRQQPRQDRPQRSHA